MRYELVLLVLVFISACVQQPVPITDIRISGHGEQIYQFSYDIRESVSVKAEAEQQIRGLLINSSKLSIIFNSSAEDNVVFQVVVFNIAAKLPTYFSYEGKLLHIDAFYYKEDGYLYNKSEERVEMPSNARIMLLGPNTGAEETSVSLDGNTVILQGVTRKDIVLAGDKLALIVMGIDEKEVEDIVKSAGQA